MKRIEVPAGEGRAALVEAGTSFKVIDPDGGQVGDLFAFAASDISEFVSASHTRPAIGKLFPKPGDQVLSNRRRPMLILEEDTSPGRHDMLYAACDPARYRLLGVQQGHRSCEQNLLEAMEAVGFSKVQIPQPLNIFMEVLVGTDESVRIQTATSKVGDYVSFRALVDCYVALSSCPMDVIAISAGGVSPLVLEIDD